MLDGSHQVELLQFSSRNQSIKYVNAFFLNAAMEYLDQERASICSTKKTLPATTDPLENETNSLEQETGNRWTHGIYISVEEMTGKIYTDQVVQFQVKYSGGSSYDMLIYDYESNEILTQAIKNEQNKQWQKNTRNCMEH